jgi:hypothetical protein
LQSQDSIIAELSHIWFLVIQASSSLPPFGFEVLKGNFYFQQFFVLFCVFPHDKVLVLDDISSPFLL